jgi:hypothetical protein
MNYEYIMSQPSDVPNTKIYEHLRSSVTPEDIKSRTRPDLFACSHLIAWAIKHKKFEEYYSYMAKFKEEQEISEAQKRLISDMTVIVRFDCAGVPIFGFFTDIDGEDGLRFPSKDVMKCVYL